MDNSYMKVMHIARFRYKVACNDIIQNPNFQCSTNHLHPETQQLTRLIYMTKCNDSCYLKQLLSIFDFMLMLKPNLVPMKVYLFKLMLLIWYPHKIFTHKHATRHTTHELYSV